MRIRTFQLVALTTGVATAGLVCFHALSAPQSESTPNEDSTLNPPVVASAATTTEDPSPPVTPPEPAPSALESTTLTPPLLSINTALEGVVRQLRAGVEEEVLLTYISNATSPFEVGSEEIIYLTDLGAPGRVINAMIERDHQLQSPASISESTVPSPEPWPAAGTVAQVPASDAAPPAPEIETVVVESPATDVSVDYFYNYLAPYGTWVNIPEYGLCWQPGAALTTTGWIPYGDRGRWVYTNYGWYWYSDYSWGWATFHYGRWQYNNRWGWCWSPGTVWGPSWVSWRYSGTYCGWAPLPPCTSSGFYFSVGISWGIPSWCYTYVPSYNVCSYYPRKCAVPYDQARRIHGQSQAYNNYTVDRNNTIHNRGIPPETLARNSNVNIRRANVQARNELPSGRVRGERMDPAGQTLTVSQPGLATRSRAESTQPRERDESLSMSRNRSNVSRTSTAMGNSGNGSASLNQPRSTRGSSASSTPTVTRHTPSTPSVNSRAAEATPSRVTTRDESTSRNRSVGRAVAIETTTHSPTPSTQREPASAASRRTPQSSLVIIGRRDSKTFSAPKPAQTIASTTTASTPSSERSATGGYAVSTRDSTQMARPTSTVTSSGNSRSTPTRVEATRTVTRVPPRATETPGTTRSRTTLPTRSTPPQITRSSTINRSVPLSTQVRSHPATQPRYTAPAQRITPPSAPTRTFSPPARPTRSAPAAPVQRSAPSYSPRSAPSRASAPSAPQSASRSAPSSSLGNRGNGRGR